MGEANFNLKCVVDKMAQPLTLGVTANCFEVQPFVWYQTKDGENVTLHHKSVNTLELKSVKHY